MSTETQHFWGLASLKVTHWNFAWGINIQYGSQILWQLRRKGDVRLFSIIWISGPWHSSTGIWSLQTNEVFTSCFEGIVSKIDGLKEKKQWHQQQHSRLCVNCDVSFLLLCSRNCPHNSERRLQQYCSKRTKWFRPVFNHWNCSSLCHQTSPFCTLSEISPLYMRPPTAISV